MMGHLIVGVVGGLDVLHEVDGDAVQNAGSPHRGSRVPPRCDLDRVHISEGIDQFVVELEV